jgi:pimeloyl-ACP methyl ester carboxylesterase
MKTFRRVAAWALASGILALLVVPLIVPVESSGTKTYKEAAGASAQFVELDGLDVYVENTKYSGDCNCQAPLMLLLHGFGASSFSWREVSQPLSKLAEVVSYDRPAFGFTERPTEWTSTNPYSLDGQMQLLDGLVAKFGQGREIILVGHSAGGQIAAEFARLNPQKVSSLILVDPAILTTGGIPGWLTWVLDIPQIDRVGPLLVGQISSSGDSVIRQSWFDESKITEEIYAGYRAPLQIKGWERAFWEFVKAPRANELADNLNQISQDTLVITGDTDNIVPTAEALKLAGLMASAELEVLANTGHLPQEESPVAFIDAIKKNAKFLGLN